MSAQCRSKSYGFLGFEDGGELSADEFTGASQTGGAGSPSEGFEFIGGDPKGNG
jgi:hypothetical protein